MEDKKIKKEAKEILRLIKDDNYNITRPDHMILREIIYVIKYLIDTNQIKIK